MSNYANAKAYIDTQVYSNHANQVTAPMVNNAIKKVIDTIIAGGYLYKGIAHPGDPAITSDANIFVIATEAGTYTNFGGLVVADGEVAVLKYNGSWSKEVTGAATAAQVSALGQKIDGLALGKFYGFIDDVADLPAGDDPGYAYVGASSPFSIYNFDGNVWSDSGSIYEPSEGNGEDIDTNAQGKLQFANRPNTNGIGYKILRTDATFASQITDSDTVYEIRYAFDLGGASVTIPARCVLKFVGGSLSNGDVDLNVCGIDGPGIDCDFTNPAKNNYPLSFFVKTQARIGSAIQMLIDAGCPVFIDIDNISLSSPIYIRTNGAKIRGIGGVRRKITFLSRGFVFDTAGYYSSMVFENLDIETDGHAFDFANSNSSNWPNNVYRSVFKNLRVKSTSGSCFYCGTNGKGSGGDNLFFNNTFGDVGVDAPAGYGFYYMNSITNSFDYVWGGECLATFYNCSGLVTNFNGIGGDTFLKVRGERCTMQMANCNIEESHGVIFDCNNSSSDWVHLIMDSCRIFVNPRPGQSTIDYFPLDFYYIYDLCIRDLKFYPSASYDSGKCPFRIAMLPNAEILTDMDLDVYDTAGGRVRTITAGSKYSGGSSLTGYNNKTYRTLGDVIVGTERLDTFIFNYQDYTPSNTLLKWTGNNYMRISKATDDGNNQNLDALDLNYTYPNNDAPLIIIVKNKNANSPIVFRHKISGYAKNFTCVTGANISVSPNGFAFIIFYPNNNTAFVYPQPTANLPAGTTRPTDGLYVGMQFFDSALSPARPIWYTGSGWVDATGASV